MCRPTLPPHPTHTHTHPACVIAPVGEQFECQGGGDLVRDVGHADVKVREVHLHHVGMDYLQRIAVWCSGNSSLQLQHLHRHLKNVQWRAAQECAWRGHRQTHEESRLPNSSISCSIRADEPPWFPPPPTPTPHPRSRGIKAGPCTHHAGVQLHGHHFFRAFQQLHGQVARAGPNFQDHIGGLEPGLVDDGLHHQRVFQDVLAFGLVELDACMESTWCATV